MPEHTIPAELIESIRQGRAILVVGVGVGVPSWKQVLEKMNDVLRDRGGEGDDAASRDVDKLLHKGSLVRAAGFLGRTLGEEACDQVLQQLWATPSEVPEVASTLMRLPFRQVWTTFPGDLFDSLMTSCAGPSWPESRVVTWEGAGEIDKRRRTLLKILGDFSSFVVTPKSTRRMLSKATALRDHVHPFYERGSLVFVGFRFGDPDLAALLDRVLGQFEPSTSQHYLVASGVGPVTVEELDSEHQIQVINLPGKGTDERATSALIEFLGDLEAACQAAGIDLAQGRPDDDDLEGWLAVLEEEPLDPDAREKIAAIEDAAHAAEDWERVVEVLMGRIEIEASSAGRAALLSQVAEVFETRIGDLPRAFTALTAALREDPTDTQALDKAEQLAEDTGSLGDLVTDLAEMVQEIDDKAVAAGYWARLGTWYHKRLDHPDYAVAAFREAIRLDPQLVAAHRGLGEVYRTKQRWAELADTLAVLLEHESEREVLVRLNLDLGELQENQLGSPARAMDAYQAAFDLDEDNDHAMVALERLYRRDERWGQLARVLERRADLLEAQGESQAAAATRRELGTLRAEKLGDLEGAIARYEATLKTNPRDVAALRALEDLYDKVGRTDDYLATIEQLAEVAPSGERPKLLRRLAIEAEDRDESSERAIRSYEQVLALEPSATDARSALERLYRKESRWDDLLANLTAQAENQTAPAVRADKWAAAGDVYETEVNDLGRAIEMHQNALAAQGERTASLTALSRLYLAADQAPRALEIVVQHAKLAGDKGGDLWVEAADIATNALEDAEVARHHLEKALAVDPTHAGALEALARIHQEAGQWQSAGARLVEAAEHASHRGDKVAHLMKAAVIYDTKLEQGDRALGAWLKVLDLDPENQEAGVLALDRLKEAEKWAEALSVSEMLARTAPEGDKKLRAAREADLGWVSGQLGMQQKAVKHYRAAAAADPSSLDIALGLSSAVFDAARQSAEGADWKEVESSHRDLLVRHQVSMSDGQVADLWFRMGEAARGQGIVGKAEESYRRALERDMLHGPSLEAVASIASEKGDFKGVVSARRRLAEAAEGEARAKLLEELGDLCHEKLSDVRGALSAYEDAIEILPSSHVLLHKALELYSETKQWRRAIDMLDALVTTESDLRRRAKYHRAAAVVALEELRDPELAASKFQLALADDPALDRAFEGLEESLRQRGDWKGLARALRGRLKALGEEAPPEQVLPLWTRLGEVCLDELDDTESAIAAFEVASSIDPDDVARHEQLAELYLDAGESRREDAIEELQFLVAADPDRVELYRALANLYRESNELDKAYCLAQALVFLKAASPAEQQLYKRLRPSEMNVSRRRLTEELWQKAILHGKEDRHVNAIFASLVGPIAGQTAQPPTAYHLDKAEQVDLTSSTRPLAKMVTYVGNVLAVELDPSLYLLADGQGVRIANTTGGGKLRPALLVNAAEIERMDDRELSFELGKRMAYLRADRYVSYAMTTLATLETAFGGALAAAGVQDAADAGPEVAGMAQRLAKSTPQQVLLQVAVIARKMNDASKNGMIGSWRNTCDLTANRVGLILCNDLETAARRIAVESGGFSSLPIKDRLRDLLAYSVSEEYFAVRRHLGLALEAKATAA